MPITEASKTDFPTWEKPEEDITSKFSGSGSGPATAPTGARPGGNPLSARSSNPRPSNIEKGLLKLYEQIGTITLLVDPVCGTAIIEDADVLAHALAEYAKTNPKVEKAIRKLIETSAFGQMLTAHLPLILTVASHHTPLNKVVAQRLGATDAEGNPIAEHGAIFVQGMINNVRKAREDHLTQ